MVAGWMKKQSIVAALRGPWRAFVLFYHLS